MGLFLNLLKKKKKKRILVSFHPVALWLYSYCPPTYFPT